MGISLTTCPSIHLTRFYSTTFWKRIVLFLRSRNGQPTLHKMGRILLGIIAALASFYLAESIICNKCSVGLLGVCLNQAEENCTDSTDLCVTARATFPSISDFVGFNTQGCKAADDCAGTSNGTLLGVTFTTVSECCNTDKCNPVTLSGAPSTQLSVTAALGLAAMASVWGSVWF